MNIVEPSDESSYLQNKVKQYEANENWKDAAVYQKKLDIQQKKDEEKSYIRNERIVDEMLSK